MKVVNASFSYDKFLVFDNVSIDLSLPEPLFIWGDNGSGKSTLLRCMAGIQKFTFYELNESQRKRCYIPADPIHSLMPWYSVKKNIELFRELDLERFKGFCNKFDQEILPSETIGKLSSGQKVLVLMYCLCGSEGIFLIDETLSYLAHRYRAVVHDWLNEIVLSGSRVVVVSHDIGLLQTSGIRIYDIDKRRDICFKECMEIE